MIARDAAAAAALWTAAAVLRAVLWFLDLFGDVDAELDAIAREERGAPCP